MFLSVFFEPSSMIWIHSKTKTFRTQGTKQFAQLWRNYEIACDLQEGMDKNAGHTTDVNRERHFLSIQHVPMGSGGGFRESRENLAKGRRVRSTATRNVTQLTKGKSSTRRRTGRWINRRVRHRTQNYRCKLWIQFVKSRTNQRHERDRDQGRLAERKLILKDSELTLKMAIDMKKVQQEQKITFGWSIHISKKKESTDWMHPKVDKQTADLDQEMTAAETVVSRMPETKPDILYLQENVLQMQVWISLRSILIEWVC